VEFVFWLIYDAISWALAQWLGNRRAVAGKRKKRKR
jgi:hypothetical protein